MTHFSDGIRIGEADYPGGTTLLGGAASHLYAVEFGAITALDADGICVNATATAADSSLSATGALMSGGVATLATPRNVTLYASTNNSTRTFTITGTDLYGQTQTETLTGPNNATVSGVKAFKTITNVAVNGSLNAAGVDVGVGDVWGLPYRIANKGKVLGLFIDGDAVGCTPVAGFSTTGTSTATTADVRGTITATTAANGSLYFTALIAVDGTTKETLYGVAPA